MATPDNVLQSQYHFVINCYTDVEIDQVIDDLNAYKNGCYYLYTLDTYDIIENYLPYTQIELFTGNDRHTMVQKMVCYDYFFGNLNKTVTVLLDEYKIELFAAKNRLLKHLKDAQIVMKNLEQLRQETEDFVSGTDQVTGFLKENFEIILLLLILNKKSNSALEEFLSFIRERLDVRDIRVPKRYDHEKVNDIFARNRCTGYSAEVFKDYVDKNKTSLLSISKNSDRHVFLENTFRDIQVMERVTLINADFDRERMNCQSVYLSSANKTKDIYKIFCSKQDVQSPAQNIRHAHRNIYQYFLFDRLKKEYRDDLDKAIEILVDLKELLIRLNNKSDKPSAFTEANVAIVKRLFDDGSSNLDNHFFVSVYEKYRSTFESILQADGQSLLDKNELAGILREIERNKDYYKSKIATLEFTLSQLIQSYDVVDAFINVKDFVPEYRYASDIIRSPYQHLPMLPLFNSVFDSRLKDKLYLFLAQSTEIKQHMLPPIVQSLTDVVAECDQLDLTKLKNRFIRFFMVTYLNFVAQSKRPLSNQFKRTDAEQTEEAIITDLEKQFEIVTLNYTQMNTTSTSAGLALGYRVKQKDLLTEIAYVLLWMYRRRLEEDKGLAKIAILGLIGTEDARILQGIGLCYISKVYRGLSKDGITEDPKTMHHIESAIDHLHRSHLKYMEVPDTLQSDTMLQLVTKNHIAVLNSLADIYLRKYELNSGKEDTSLLEDARACITHIKSLFETLCLDYNEYPTYVATETEIDCLEAEFYYNQRNFILARSKVVEASIRFSQLKRMAGINQVDEFFIRKLSRITSLTHDIINI